MGEMADDYDYGYMGFEVDDEIWTTKDGRDMYYFEMELEHLLAIKKMIERKGGIPPYNLLREIHAKRKVK